jgi:hypothetical protein
MSFRVYKWAVGVLGIALLHTGALTESGIPEQITIDAAKDVGRIKRLNDVDNGPLCQRGIVDLTPYYKEVRTSGKAGGFLR